ncbi:hypothetical protein NUW54_g10677 [Trametes sanguinea]|uniref:Uncharacterized protein n=1 Tax=Trametes sanguinea TaxID=158606 RepID=A0ACC1NUL8_9APHY|nr:hypothetical protein NUW54_g10677 [Trametes sanguinea]
MIIGFKLLEMFIESKEAFDHTFSLPWFTSTTGPLHKWTPARCAALSAAMASRREADLAQALKVAQLEVGRLQDVERKLLEENAQLCAQLKQLQLKGRGKSSRARGRGGSSGHAASQHNSDGSESEEFGYDDEQVMRLGKMFGAIAEPWILPHPTLALKQRCPDVAYNDPQRFTISKPEALLPWITAEIYHYVPSDYHLMLESYVPFTHSFITGHKNMRSNAVRSVRSNAAQIFSIRADWVTRHTTVIDKAYEPILLQYLKFDHSNPTSAYDVFPPLLYPGFIKDPAATFRVPHLLKICKVLLFGPASIQGEEGDSNGKKRKKQWTGPPPNAVLWGLAHVTPGLIAYAAILATFVLSSDDEFTPQGKNTRIDYWERFRQYKKYLMSTSEEHLSWSRVPRRTAGSRRMPRMP